MASWQAHLGNVVLRWQVKRRLRGMRDIGDLDRARAVFTSTAFPPPPGVRIRPAHLGGVPGEWLEGDAARATLFYLHGGGYFSCSPQTHRPITGAYARQGFRVFAPDYRLAPEHPFPAAVEDALAAWRGLLAEGAAPGRTVLGGDSAGGGLALALLVRLRDLGLPMPAAAALFSPWTDLAATGASLRSNDRRDAMFHGGGVARIAALYLNGADPRTPLASPLYADLTGLPPLLIHVGEREVLRDDSTRLAARARAQGVAVSLKIWPVLPHVWQMAQPFVPEARQSLREAAAFLHDAAARAPQAEAAELS